MPDRAVLLLRLLPAVFSVSLLACSPPEPVEGRTARVVYGDDDRLEVYQHPNELFRRIARESIVALIPGSRLDMSDPSDVAVVDLTLQEAEGLCEGERFLDQPTGAACSGTLIDADLVLTAGHCVESMSECRARRIVFGYHYESDGELGTITTDDIYRCRRRVALEDTRFGADYAVIQLDRPVGPGRVPVAVRLADEPLPLGTKVAVLGFPSGLPLKIDDGGQVIDPHPDDLNFFEATTDTFDANSGSGVFDHGGQLVGALVRGEDDYEPRGPCQVVRTLPEDSPEGGGEDITYVARAVEGLCDLGWASDLCGDTGGWCRPCGGDAGCPPGWSCDAHESDPGVTWCAMPCEPGDCREGHTCDTSTGSCRPSTSPRCYRDQVYTFNSCGRPIVVGEECEPTEVCRDGGCVEAGPGNACASATELSPVDQVIRGTLDERYDNQSEGGCGGGGKDQVFRFTLDRATRLVAEATGFDTLLYVRSDCSNPSTELVCEDDTTPPGRRGTRIAIRLEPGAYSLFLDAYGESFGSYELSVLFQSLEDPPDAGPPDGSTAGVLDGGLSDASSPDSSFTPTDPGGGGGCGCAVGPAARVPPGLQLLALAAFGAWARRGRRRPGRSSAC